MMINSGEKLSHYIVGNAEIIVGSRFQPIPDAMIVSIILTENLSVYLNGVLQLNKIDYNINGSEIEFVEYTAQIGDVIELRYYEKLANTFVPPSSSKLDINALYIPRVVTDSEYHPDVEMILGHDGSLVPAWNDRTDEILLEFETMIFNRLSVTSTDNTIKFHNYGMYRDASEEYSVAEKKYTQYPFFKKWMIEITLTIYTMTHSILMTGRHGTIVLLMRVHLGTGAESWSMFMALIIQLQHLG